MEWLGENAWAAWLAATALLATGELLGLELVLLMLAVGTTGGMVAALVGAPVVAQVLLAAAVSAAMLILVRPSVVKRLHGNAPELRLGTSKLVGATALVTSEVSGEQVGRIRLEGEVWSAAPYDDSLVMAVGQTVEVFEIRGATAYVHPVDGPL